jgi:hypothetical protein
MFEACNLARHHDPLQQLLPCDNPALRSWRGTLRQSRACVPIRCDRRATALLPHWSETAGVGAGWGGEQMEIVVNFFVGFYDGYARTAPPHRVALPQQRP